MAVAPGKSELRTYVPEATGQFLRSNCGTRGIGEFIHDVCVFYQQHQNLEARLDRIDQRLVGLLDRK